MVPIMLSWQQARMEMDNILKRFLTTSVAREIILSTIISKGYNNICNLLRVVSIKRKLFGLYNRQSPPSTSGEHL